MAIELWCLKWTLLLSSAAATGHLFGLTERISSAASGECCGDDDDGTITKKTKETEHLFSIEDEEGASSDQYLFFQLIILAAPLDMYKGCPFLLLMLLFAHSLLRTLFLEEAPVLVFRIFLPVNRIDSTFN